MMGVMDCLPASVLVIESHPIMRAALCTAIAEEPDLQVAAVQLDSSQIFPGSGMQDLDLLPETPDMILLALGNPGRKELEALKRLRQALPGVPVLALTSDEVAGQEQAALEAGAQSVVTKTGSRQEIMQALRDMYRRSSISHHQDFSRQEVKKNNPHQNQSF